MEKVRDGVGKLASGEVETPSTNARIADAQPNGLKLIAESCDCKSWIWPNHT